MTSMYFDKRRALIPTLFCAAALAQTPSAKPSLTLDDFFNSVDIPNVRIAPDGRAVAIETSVDSSKPAINRQCKPHHF